MDFQLDKDWHLQPIEGDTGKTYMGIRASEKVFIKTNSSPFLAALSREGITPKLVWTKRTGNGDVLTAQEWLEGTVLNPQEMGGRLDIIRILHHLHHSDSLKNMLAKVGGKEMSAFTILCMYAKDLPSELNLNHYLQRVFRYLEDHLPELAKEDYRACHGDPTNQNWLFSKEGRLYLVDWDSTMLADPAVDLGIILGRYVPILGWSTWLNTYGLSESAEMLEKIHWYSCMDYLLRIKNYYSKSDFKAMNLEILQLKQIFAY